MENKVSFIRLLNGDDLIAEVISATKTLIIIKNPMLIINNIEIEEGRQTLILYPWIPQGIALGNTAEIRVSNILMINEIEPEILDYYKGIVEHAFATKPKVVSSTTPKASESGKNVISFTDASLKNKKDIH
jgi:hypothetical protein